MHSYTNPKEDQRDTDELFKLLLKAKPDSNESALTSLHFRGTREVFDKAINFLNSSDDKEREVAIDVLAQLGVPKRSFFDETIELLLNLLDKEKSPNVIAAIGFAFSHNKVEEAVKPLCKLKNHQSSLVREGIVSGIMEHDSDLAIETLIELSEDSNSDVRNMATFALGTLCELSRADINNALAKRLNDNEEEVQGEAMIGLAVRKDPRATEPIIDELSSDRVRVYAIEAASKMAKTDFYPYLIKLKDRGGDRHFEQVLSDAINACSPPKDQS